MEDTNDVLKKAYAQLIDSREALISGFAGVETSRSVRQLLADSLILGLMNHYHDVANDPDKYEDRLVRGLGLYATGLSASVVQKLSGVSGGRQTESGG